MDSTLGNAINEIEYDFPIVVPSATGTRNPIVAINKQNGMLIMTEDYPYELTNERVINIVGALNRNGLRNIVTSNIFRAILTTINNENTYINVRTPVVGEFVNADAEYANTYYASLMTTSKTSTKVMRTPIHLSGIRIKQKYKVVRVPKDVQMWLNQLHVYFDELKPLLKYNDKSGYYYIEVGKDKLDVLCRHLYMFYSGESYQAITLECYHRGKCKYCGTPMSAYIEDTSIRLPTKVYSIIYSFVATIKTTLNESLLIANLIKLISTEIVAKPQLKSEDDMVAFTYLYLYKAYLDTNELIAYVKKSVSVIIDKAIEASIRFGMNRKELEASLNNLFRNTSSIAKVFKDVLFVEGDFDNSFLTNVLMDTADKYVLDAFKAGKMKLLNETVMIYYFREWNYKFTVKRTKEKCNIILKAPVKNESEKALLAFFKKVWKVLCPVNGAHAFVAGKCSFCGISSKGTNVDDVFKKYLFELGNSFIVSTETKLKYNELEKRTIDISKYKPDELYKLHLSELTQNQKALIKSAMEKDAAPIHAFITDILGEVPNAKGNESKYILYILDNKLISSSMLSSTLLNMYMPIRKILYMD